MFLDFKLGYCAAKVCLELESASERTMNNWFQKLNSGDLDLQGKPGCRCKWLLYNKELWLAMEAYLETNTNIGSKA